MSRLPEPDLEHLHPDGDIFYGRRLPEFEVRWVSRGQAHPLRVVGRYLLCRTHSEFAPILLGGEGESPCMSLIRAWPSLFNEDNFWVWSLKIEDLWPYEQAEGSALTQVMQRVKATMLARVQESLRKPLLHLKANGFGEGGMRDWLRHGEIMGEAHERGLHYSAWAQLLDAQLPQLARPGLILGGSRKVGRSLLAFLDCPVVPEHKRDLAAAFDNLFEEVNLWSGLDGFDREDMAALYPTVPYKQGAEAVQGWLFNATITRRGMFNRGSRVGLLPQAEIIAQLEAELAQAGLEPKVGLSWCRQGLFAPEEIKAAQKLSQEHPAMGPGRVAWFVRHTELPVLEQGLGELTAISTDDLAYAEAYDYIHLGRSRQEKVLLDRVVPVDWWRPTVNYGPPNSPTELDEPSAEEVGLSI